MIEVKLEQFLSGKMKNVNKIPKKNIAKLGISVKCNLKNIFFEKNISIQSQIISRQLSSFFGKNSYMNDTGYIRSNVFVGRYCSIGRRVTIGAGDHDMHCVSTSPSLNRNGNEYNELERNVLNTCSKERSIFTIINNDVWIGDGSIIMQGVTIGNGVVIGANSVVTKDIPDYSIVAGAPAKIIKTRFPENVSSKLVKTSWWNLSEELLNSLPTKNVFQFLESIEYYNNYEEYDSYVILE